MTQRKPISGMGELAYVLGVILCALGVCFSAKSGFGVSMVVAPAYVLHCKLEPLLPFFSFGVAEYVLQGGLILLLCPFVGRFKKKFLLSFATAVFYGVVLDLWRGLFGTGIPGELWQRIFFCVLGGCITAFAIALLLRTYLPQQGYELVVKELSDRYGWAMGKVKWIYDMSSLGVAILLMLLLFGEFSFSMIGAGTLLLTLVNTPLITGFGKILDRFFEFTPFFPRFHGFFQKHFD
ncbi:MAG: hypothetical protein J6S15_00875 [Clostridia bacterium]|nr:hypothetical protein [Clostridia bacterium]